MFLSSIFLWLVFALVFSQVPTSGTLVQTASRCVSECVSFEWWTVTPPWPWIGLSKEWLKWNEWIDVGFLGLLLSFFLCIQHETQNTDRLVTHLRQPTQSKRQWDGKGEEKAESPLKVTEFSMPHITYIPFPLPFQLSHFINRPLLTYKQALNH